MAKTGIDATKFKTFLRKWDKGIEDRDDEIGAVLSKGAELVLRRAKTHYLTGAALRVQTGRLRSHTTKQPSTGAFKRGSMTWVEVGTNVWYGRAWEFGFTIPQHIIVPKTKKALSFVTGGKRVFAKSVTMPQRKVPARPWLQPSIEDSMPKLTNLLAKVGVNI